MPALVLSMRSLLFYRLFFPFLMFAVAKQLFILAKPNKKLVVRRKRKPKKEQNEKPFIIMSPSKVDFDLGHLFVVVNLRGQVILWCGCFATLMLFGFSPNIPFFSPNNLNLRHVFFGDSIQYTRNTKTVAVYENRAHHVFWPLSCHGHYFKLEFFFPSPFFK